MERLPWFMLQVMDWGPMRIPEPEAQLWAQAAGRAGWTVQHGGAGGLPGGSRVSGGVGRISTGTQVTGGE